MLAVVIAAGLLLAACGSGTDNARVDTGGPRTTSSHPASGALAVPTSNQAEGPRCPAEAPGSYTGELVAGFPSTAGELRTFGPAGGPGPAHGRWPELADGTPLALCWYDGVVAKSPPPGGDGPVQPHDRFAVVVFSGERVELLVSGYRDRLTPTGPE